jgi:glycosyltransferase involved in cell wall biosynthesis
MPAIVKDAPDFTLLLVGAGSLEDELKTRARELGVADNIIFTGFRTDVKDILAALDVYVLPSLSEGLGTAIIEAAAAGRAIVTSNVGGIPDVITDGKTGLLVSPENSEGLTTALLRFYKDRAFAQHCGEAAAKHARENFSEELLGEKTEAFYQTALGWKRS